MSGDVIGWACITYSLAEARAVRPRVLKDAALAAVAAILINLWLLLLYLRRPLRAIRLATEFSTTLNTRRGDEIAVNAETVEIEQLQRSLNFASQQLWQEHRAMTDSARTAAGGAHLYRRWSCHPERARHYRVLQPGSGTHFRSQQRSHERTQRRAFHPGLAQRPTRSAP